MPPKSVPSPRTVAVMQPYLFPYLGYYQLLAASDVFVLFDDVHFTKRSYITRNSLLLGGVSQRFSLSVANASQNRLISEHDLHGRPDDMLALIRRAYGDAPYGDVAIAFAQGALSADTSNLAAFLEHGIRAAHRLLGLEGRIEAARTLDYDRSGKGEARILDLCRRFGAARYVNAPGGRALYDAATFADQGVELSFIDYRPRPYPQFGNDGDFVSHLSILDSLANRPLADIRAEVTDLQLTPA